MFDTFDFKSMLANGKANRKGSFSECSPKGGVWNLGSANAYPVVLKVWCFTKKMIFEQPLTGRNVYLNGCRSKGSRVERLWSIYLHLVVASFRCG